MSEIKFKSQMYLLHGCLFVSVAYIYTLIEEFAIGEYGCFVVGILCWFKAAKLFFAKGTAKR